jgi:hypothetical protein
MGHFHDLPIFIVNYNQLAGLRKQLEWLVHAGYRQIHVLDNRSTYPALLRYYEEVERTYKGAIKVITLEKNFGCRGPLTENILDRFKSSVPYVYSDSDVVPDTCCPADVVEHLVSLLDANPDICKAGLGLRLDDLPKTYGFREQAVLWESQFWRRPVSRGLFRASIDTTFAVYRPDTPFALAPALRTGWPYLARHEPWYSDSSRPSDEERFYDLSPRVHDTHWAGSRMPEWLETTCSDLKSDRKQLLNLGCGHNTMGGWINIDVRDDVGADVVFDLNTCSTAKLPLGDETIDGFYMCDVFERIRDPFSLMQELYRVAKPNAKLVIRCIYRFGNENRVATHRDIANTFICFGPPAHSGSESGYSGDWCAKRVRLIVPPHLLDGKDEIVSRPWEGFACDTIIELVAVKPKRQPQPGQIEWPNPVFASSPIDDEISF